VEARARNGAGALAGGAVRYLIGGCTGEAENEEAMQRAGALDKESRTLIGILLVILAVVGAVVFLSKTQDPLGGQTANLEAYLSEEKTLCESRAQDLQAKRIDGRAEYEKPQAAANACIAYLIGMLDQGSGDKNQLADRMARLNSASVRFRTWAAQQLGAGHGAEAMTIDPLALASAIRKLLDAQEKDRREQVKKSLEKYKFRSWEDIRAGKAGALK
jgi:hypothetical protein